MSETQFFGIFMLAGLLFNLLPAAFVFFSTRVHGGERLLWMFGVLFTSWPGFIVFMAVTTMSTRTQIAKTLPVRRVPTAGIHDISDHRKAG